MRQRFSARAWWGCARRRGGALLLAAYLPSLLFLGHWSPRIDIPGTDLYIGLAEHAPAHHDEEAHHRHCHGDAGNCSDTPLATAVPVAVLAASIAGGAAERPSFALPGDVRVPRAGPTTGPETPPPRAA